jgi:dimethyladenosine transferase 1
MKIFHGDALTFPIGQHLNRDGYKKDWNDDPPNVHLIGNLPFNISTPLLFRLLLKVSDRNGNMINCYSSYYYLNLIIL